ncbi:MAG: ATP-binding protein [Simkania sp.]|nr:ATP-binding protein [Simkania sp.]
MLNIEEMLHLPEGRTLEFKENLTSCKPILRTLVAFANAAGGTLIVGRKDDGTILGVEDILASEEKLTNVIADSIYPPLMPEIEIPSQG